MHLPENPYSLQLNLPRYIRHRKTETAQRSIVKPFIYWVGSKRSILSELLVRLPKHYDRYHEPFLGSGALYLCHQPPGAYLSDINNCLTGAFITVRDNLKVLIEKLKSHKAQHSKDYYYEARARFCVEQDVTSRAGLFIYLNRTCFHGAYRIDSKGSFNVSYGARKNPGIFDEASLYNASQALQGTNITTISFERKKAAKNDFFYFDPPYHESNVKYGNKGFHVTEHRKLSALCQEIDRKGGYFMVSNSDTPFVRQLYKGFHIERVVAQRSFSKQTAKRGKVAELLIRNYE